jgi:hypothetical protein
MVVLERGAWKMISCAINKVKPDSLFLFVSNVPQKEKKSRGEWTEEPFERSRALANEDTPLIHVHQGSLTFEMAI